MLPTEKSMTFFIMMFPAFFALVKPASTRANPRLHEHHEDRCEHDPDFVDRYSDGFQLHQQPPC
jgi:hypothetical protein